MNRSHHRTSLAWGIPGVLLQIAGNTLAAVAIFGYGKPEMGQAVLFIAGLVCLMIGLVYYAKAKGRSPIWGLLGVFSIFGLIILACLKDLENEEQEPQSRTTPCTLSAGAAET